MNTLKISVILAAKTALRLGLTYAGNSDYSMMNVVPLLSDEVREWLSETADVTDGVIRLDHRGWKRAVELDDAPSDHSVARAIHKAFDEQMRLKEERKAEHEARIEEALSAPLEDWIYVGKDGPGVCSCPKGVYLPDDTVDTRLDDRKEQARKIALPVAISQWQVEIQAKEAEAERKKREVEAKEEQREAENTAMRAWASSQTELPTNIRRAACDGFDIRPAVKKYLAEAVDTAILTIVEPLGGTTMGTYADEETDRVPTDMAYEIRDALVERVVEIEQAAMIPGTKVKIGTFCRVDVSDSRDYDWRSAVEVVVDAPWIGDIGVFVITEPTDEDENEDDSDE